MKGLVDGQAPAPLLCARVFPWCAGVLLCCAGVFNTETPQDPMHLFCAPEFVRDAPEFCHDAPEFFTPKLLEAQGPVDGLPGLAESL